MYNTVTATVHLPTYDTHRRPSRQEQELSLLSTRSSVHVVVMEVMDVVVAVDDVADVESALLLSLLAPDGRHTPRSTSCHRPCLRTRRTHLQHHSIQRCVCAGPLRMEPLGSVEGKSCFCTDLALQLIVKIQVVEEVPTRRPLLPRPPTTQKPSRSRYCVEESRVFGNGAPAPECFQRK